MRSTILNCAVVAMPLFFSTAALSQSNCDELKKENEYLKKALKVITPEKTITAAKTDFNLLKCIGNSKEQTVDIQLTIVNKDANRDIQFFDAKGIDLEGNEYEYKKIMIGSKSIRNTIYTDVPLKTTVTLEKVLPSVKMLKIVPLKFLNEKGGTSTIELKDLAIEWK